MFGSKYGARKEERRDEELLATEGGLLGGSTTGTDKELVLANARFRDGGTILLQAGGPPFVAVVLRAGRVRMWGVDGVSG